MDDVQYCKLEAYWHRIYLSGQSEIRRILDKRIFCAPVKAIPYRCPKNGISRYFGSGFLKIL